MLALLLGIGVRLVQLDYALDSDESFSVLAAGKPFAETVAVALADRSHPPLHLLLLHGWMQAFGAGEVQARLSSVVTFAGFLGVAFLLLRRFASGWPLGAGLLLFAGSPLFVYYGQLVRPYALVMLFSALVLERYFALADDPCSARRRWTFTAACALAAATQYLAVGVIGACLLASLFAGRSTARATWLHGLVGASAVLPWAAAAMLPSLFAGRPVLDMLEWIGTPTVESIVWFLASPFGVPSWGRAALVLIPALALVAWGLVANVHSRPSAAPSASRDALVGRRAHDVLLLVLVAFAFPLAAYAVSVLGGPPAFVTRQLLGALVALVLLIVIGAACLPRAYGGLVLAALVAWTASTAHTGLPAYTRPDWREVATAIRETSPTYVAADVWLAWPLTLYVGPPHPTGAALPEGAVAIACRADSCARYRALAERRAVRDVRVVAPDLPSGQVGDLKVYVLRLAPVGE